MKVASIAQTVEEQPHIRRQFQAASDAVARPFDPAADQLPNLEFGLAVGAARQGEAIGEGRAVLVAAFDCNPVCTGQVERKNDGIVKSFGAKSGSASGREKGR